jgi:flagellar hook-basal body complex protein FliE
MLSGQLQSLESSQNNAAQAARSIADGTATDPSSAIVAVDRARLAMQLASTVRAKGVEAFQDVMRTQI